MGDKSSPARGSQSHSENLQQWRIIRNMTEQELFALFEVEEERFALIDGDTNRLPRQEGVAPINEPVTDRLGGGPLCPPALHEDIAWAIAMAFYQQLHKTIKSTVPIEIHQYLDSHVALETDPLADDFDMVKSYEWITFNVRSHPSLASIARAATTTWYWLSSCPGYSGRENPRFWKRVFCELSRPFPQTVKQRAEERVREEMRSRGLRDYMTPTQKDNSITDVIRFFDHPDRPFPRVKFNSRATAPSTKHRQDDVRKCEEKLQDIWLQLEPFITKGRLQRPIDLMITGKLSRAEMDELMAPHSLGGGGGELMVRPRFVLLPPVVTAYMLPLADVQKQLQSEEVVTMPKIQFTFNANDSVSDKADRLRTLFCVDPNHSDRMRGQIHRVGPSETTPLEFAAVCSVLPHCQSFHTFVSYGPRYVHSVSLHRRGRNMDIQDWAWLGYALFHPDTQVSKWCNLDIYVGDLTAEAVQVLGLMARGNNLVHVLEGKHTNMPKTDTTTSPVYHSAQVREGTRVRAEPIDSSETLLQLHGFIRVCLCVDDVSTLDPWVRVVAPGVGFGWISSSTITEIVTRPPGKSSVQSLRLQLAWKRGGRTIAHESLPGFLSLLGRKVTNLEILDELDTTTLRAILVECPQLTSLRVKHDGSLWASADVEQLPSLQHLWLTIKNDFQAPTAIALASCLRDLTEMRVSASTCSQQTKLAVMNLLESHPGIQYLHCSDGDCLAANRRKDHGLFPYVDGRLRTQEFFSELSPRALYGDFAPFSPACQLAFLSVNRNKRQLQPPPALSRLDRDVASQIFTFASSLAPRDLWFGGE